MLAAATAAVAAPVAPRPVVVVRVAGADLETRLLVGSLQGIINREGDTVIYQVDGPGDASWLEVLRHRHHLVPTEMSPAQFVEKYRSYARGQVLCDPQQTFTIGIAAMQAAVNDAVISAKDLGLPTVFDLRGRWSDPVEAYYWARDNLLSKCAEDTVVVVDGAAPGLIDYVVQNRLFVCDLNPGHSPEDADLLLNILRRFPDGALVLGRPRTPAAAEALGRFAAERSQSYVPSDGAANLSFFARLGIVTSLDARQRFVNYQGTQTCVTFVFAGGEDVGHDMRLMRERWDDPRRGDYPLGWTVSPRLATLAPEVWRRYIVEAAFRGADEFLAAPNGAGAQPLSVHDDLTAAGRMNRRALGRAGLSAVMLRDPGTAQQLTAIVSRLVEDARPNGLAVEMPTALTQSGLYQGTPLAIEALRAEGVDQTYQELLRLQKERPFLFVVVDPAKMTPSMVGTVIDRLDSSFLVLPPLEFFQTMRLHTVRSVTGGRRGLSAARATVIEVLPQPAAPEDPITVRAQITAPGGVDTAQVVYAIPGRPEVFAARMAPTTDGGFVAVLPPIREGGDVKLQIHVTDKAMDEAWAGSAQVTVARVDGDEDGLSDAVEAFYDTDPTVADTDGDGLRDGNDRDPWRIGATQPIYQAPLYPPMDRPYVARDAGSRLTEGARRVEPGASWTYRLSLNLLPREAAPELVMLAEGALAVDMSSDGATFSKPTAIASTGPGPQVFTIPVPEAARAGEALSVRFTAEGAGGAVRWVSVTSPPRAPSIEMVTVTPPYPAPEILVEVSARIYDPVGVGEVSILLETPDGGTTTLPMAQVGGTQIYRAAIGRFTDHTSITYWIVATDTQGAVATTEKRTFFCGTTNRETISLLPRRDFVGAPGQRDRAVANFLGGTYQVWVLAAPRGQALDLTADGAALGRVEADRVDGWQLVGGVDLKRGKHQIEIGPGAQAGASGPAYTQILMTTDKGFQPPVDRLIDFYNAIYLLQPEGGAGVRGRTTIAAVAAGNVARIECWIDGDRRRLSPRSSRQPYWWLWDPATDGAGPHRIELRAFNAAGEQMLTTGVTVRVEE
jgi:hypothetical protein